jgi:inhibitor of cysteine peptidase
MDHLILTLALILVAGVLMAGCTHQGDQEKNPAVQDDKNTFPEEKNGEIASRDTRSDTQQENVNSTPERGTVTNETLPVNGTTTITLSENPTTGFQWNVTVTEGLRIEKDEYIASTVHPGIVGAGGEHYWMIRAVSKGEQRFDAIYRRSWEPVDGTEKRYIKNILVE